MKHSVFLESSIMQKGLPATAGSKMLEDFIAPVDAAVVEKLVGAGVEIVERVDIGEFGLSGLFEDGDVSFCEELTDAVSRFAKSDADAFLCNDFTGIISRAAVSEGLYYIHPTYGTVSRYGLISSVCSMDQIGVVCKEPEAGFDVLKIISGYDSRDGIMVSDRADGKKAEEPSPCFEVDVNQVSNDYSGIYRQVMQILCAGEFSNNINRYDGIKFGYRARGYKDLNELYARSRTEAFGEDVKLAAVVGAMVLYGDNYERYYNKAMCIRRLIKESPKFDMYDVIVGKCPFLSRLCGLPSLSVPGGHVYIADAGREDILKAVSKAVIGGNVSVGNDELSGKIKALKGGAL